jgi:hypothetical protein
MITKDQLTTTVMTLFVWGFAGALFGAIFAGLYQVLLALGLTGWQPLLVTTATAAMTTSAFYSAMPVALVGSMAGVLASIGYLIVAGHNIQLPLMMMLTSVAGIVAGGFYAWMIARDSQPLAQALTGLSAGVLAGGMLVLVLAITGQQVSLFALAASVVALVGSLFQISERWLVMRSVTWLPAGLSAPIVAGLIAAVVGASVGIMDGAMELTVSSQTMIGQVVRDVPIGFMGGLCGGAVTGLILELLGFRLEQHHH